ncbi:MAG: twin-arginine translocase subunit TatC [Candidatus Melainabacteria bacterium]|nr:twin-arginine translocase subunit TatC [Candidatus Melainabacteria bacterium]
MSPRVPPNHRDPFAPLHGDSENHGAAQAASAFSQETFSPGISPSTATHTTLAQATIQAEQALMPFLAHLDELRARLIVSVLAWLACTVLAFAYSNPLITILQSMAPQGVAFVQLAPGEVLGVSVRLAMMGGLMLALPVWLFHALRFVLPGLHAGESRAVLATVLGGSVLFMLGLAFAYLALIPVSLEFLLGYGQQVAHSQMSIAEYVNFCTLLFVVCGLMFELPLLLIGLSFTGVVNSHKLASQWRWVTVWVFVAAALLTPTQDPVTLTLVAAVLMALYGVSWLVIRLLGR